MAKQFYARIYKTNSVDTESEIDTLESTTEEPKIIKAIGIVADSNEGIFRGYHERDNFIEFPTGSIVESGISEIPVELELKVGESFKYTLQNVTAGSNAVLKGYVRYEIPG